MTAAARRLLCAPRCCKRKALSGWIFIRRWRAITDALFVPGTITAFFGKDQRGKRDSEDQIGIVRQEKVFLIQRSSYTKSDGCSQPPPARLLNPRSSGIRRNGPQVPVGVVAIATRQPVDVMP